MTAVLASSRLRLSRGRASSFPPLQPSNVEISPSPTQPASVVLQPVSVAVLVAVLLVSSTPADVLLLSSSFLLPAHENTKSSPSPPCPAALLCKEEAIPNLSSRDRRLARDL